MGLRQAGQNHKEHPALESPGPASRVLLQGLLHTTAAPAARSWHPEANVLSIGLGRVLNSSQLCRGRERSVASQPQFHRCAGWDRDEAARDVEPLPAIAGDALALAKPPVRLEARHRGKRPGRAGRALVLRPTVLTAGSKQCFVFELRIRVAGLAILAA